MSKVQYIREGKGTCKICANERDLVVERNYTQKSIGELVVSRHLHRIEEYTPSGAYPKGFCLGSLQPPAVAPRHGRVR